MGDALAAGAVTEESHGEVVLLALHLLGQGGAGGDGDAAGHDGVGAQVALGEVSDVHGAGAAAAVAGVTAHHLGQGLAQVAALGHAVAVAAVGGGDVVLVGHVGADGCGDCLLAQVQMDGAVDLVGAEQIPGGFLEVADLQHLLVDPQCAFLGDHNCPPLEKSDYITIFEWTLGAGRWEKAIRKIVIEMWTRFHGQFYDYIPL